MINIAKRVMDFFSKHRYGLTLAVLIAASTLTGLACVWFMWSFDFVLHHRLDFSSIGAWCWITTPVAFLLSVELIRRAAPCADGSGIPQVIFAVEHYSPQREKELFPLTSLHTMTVKVLALLLGLIAGASTGREGPTVHVATCAFVLLLMALRSVGLQFDMRSAYVAGGAAGLAAAFNTPLAGVTFALEELSTNYFSNIKDFVLIVIIIAGIAAKSLTGEYNYFGQLKEPLAVPLSALLVIGLVGGIAGAIFSMAISSGRKKIMSYESPAMRYLIVVVLSMAILAIAWLSPVDVLGPGNKIAQRLVNGEQGTWIISFPFSKALTTLFTYWSGIAGGIFAPCLSVGAAIGSGIGWWMNVPMSTCALVGMAAFLSGTIQAPITSFVIIFEMTGHHQMLLPVMLCSVLAFIAAKTIGAKHLYHDLSLNYGFLLKKDH